MNARIYEQAVATAMARFGWPRDLVVNLGCIGIEKAEAVLKEKYPKDGADYMVGVVQRTQAEIVHKILFDEIRRLEFERMAAMQGDTEVERG